MHRPSTSLVEVSVTAATTVEHRAGGVRLINAHVRGLAGGDVTCTVTASGRTAAMLCSQPEGIAFMARGRIEDGVIAIVPDAEQARQTLALAA